MSFEEFQDHIVGEKYRRVRKESTPSSENEILVTSSGSINKYVRYGEGLLTSSGKTFDTIIIKGMGRAIQRAITVSELIREKCYGVHQLVEIDCKKVVDEFEPIEEGLSKKTEERSVSLIKITLSKNIKNFKKSDPGFNECKDPDE